VALPNGVYACAIRRHNEGYPLVIDETILVSGCRPY